MYITLALKILFMNSSKHLKRFSHLASSVRKLLKIVPVVTSSKSYASKHAGEEERYKYFTMTG